MLPESYQQAYDRFQQSLQRLQQMVQTGDRASIEPTFQAAQQLFQQQVAPLDLEALEPKLALKVRSLQVEINKQMRLLATDFLFLNTARRSATADQRQQQIGDRVKMLLQYCAAVVEKSGD